MSSLTLQDYIAGVRNKTIDPTEYLTHILDTATKDTLNAFVRLHPDYALDASNAMTDLPLAGAPIAIKDNIFTQGYISSCGSHMLENYIAPYSATCFDRLQQAGGLMIGKTNMDEFAMGSSNESSFFGPVHNPSDISRVAGGSSGGSAAAVAADLCLAALGTDTGGSVRQPAALCGVVGMKPTYGRISRYGVQAMAPSLNQVGIVTKTVDDAALLLGVIGGYDSADAQSDPKADIMDDWGKNSYDPNTFRIALPKEFLGQGLDPLIKDRLMNYVAKLEAAGVVVDEVSIPLLNYVMPIYYTICPAEVSSDLARFDGIRFGLQQDMSDFSSLLEYYDTIRSTGFGEEVKRRILLGTYVLSSAHYEGLYLKAQQARDMLQQQIQSLYQTYDVILSPTSPELAWKIGEKTQDPLSMYLADLYTIPANLCGLPAMSVPAGTIARDSVNLHVGLHIMTDARQEGKLFAFGRLLEKLV